MQLLTMQPRECRPESARLRLVERAPAPQAAGLAARMVRGTASVLRSYWKMRNDNMRPRDLRVVETLHLGAKKQLLLVSCKGERFLVGTGADDVQTIVRLRREGVAADSGETL